VTEIGRSLRGIEHARGRRLIDLLRERFIATGDLEDGLLRAVFGRERLLFEPGDRRGSDPRHGTHGIDRPEDESLREVFASFGVHLVARHELALHEVELRGPRRSEGALIVRELDVEVLALVVDGKREPDAIRRLIERDVDATDALAASGLLNVPDLGHSLVG